MKKIKVSRMVFYITYALMLFKEMFSNADFLEGLFSVLNQAFIVLAIVIILTQGYKYNKKKFLLIVAIFLIILVNYIISTNSLLLELFILIIIFKDMDFNKFIKFDFIIRLLYFICVISLCKLDVLENVILYRSGEIRQSFGFSHPNTFSIYVMSICFEYIYLRYKHLKIRDFGVLLIALYFVSTYADSRTASIGIILLIIGIIAIKLFKYTKMKKDAIKKFIPLIPICCSIISIVLVILYNKVDIISTLDELLTWRISYAYSFWQEYGISVFGSKIVTISSINAKILGVSAKILDNSYWLLLINFGVLNFIIFNYLSYKSLKYLLKEESKMKEIILVILVIFFICGIVESWLIKYYYNVFILYFAMYLYNKKIGEKKGE